jgi:NAD(P)-dependent dehydrogenase (short-subunit alcohol dehydrogenase family)
MLRDTDGISTVDRRVSLVTGGTEGIGRAVAVELAKSGDRVLFIGRDRDRAAATLASLRSVGPGADHVFIRADLSLLAETARAAEEVARHTSRLDAAAFCAGILSTIPEWTSEGLERNFVLNYLSRYLMVRCLLPELTTAPNGRVVLVANAGRYADTLDFSDLQHRRGRPGLTVAGRTQFANDLLAVELAERLHGTRVEVACVFPGVVKTNVFRNSRGLPWIVRLIAPILQNLIGMTPERAAHTPASLAQMPVRINGRFYGPKLRELAVPPAARQPERRRALWEASEQLCSEFLQERELACVLGQNHLKT